MTDFKLDGNDLSIASGDLVLGESTQQHQRDIIMAGKGWFRHAPLLGVDLQRWIASEGATSQLAGTIRNELERDGQRVEQIGRTDKGFNIIAAYE